MYYPAPPIAKPKRRFSTAGIIFLSLLGLLSIAAVVFCVVQFVSQLQSPPSSSNPFYDFYRTYPEDPDNPDEDYDFQFPEPEPEEDAPKVDVVPNTEGITVNPRPSGDTLDAETVYERIVISTVTVASELSRDGISNTATGTGIIATSDGYIITNSHVVMNSKASRVSVTTYDGIEYDAVVVGVDRTTDLAVLKTNDHNFTPAEFGDADELSVGEWVLAIGNPGGSRFSSSLTRGIISGLDRQAGKYSEKGMTYIQTDAAINPGNSGGPLVNMYGQVVGINSSKIITEGYEGMGFAIPVSKAQPIINELLSGGYIKGRTRLGILCQEISKETAQLYNVPRGLRITTFNQDSAFLGTEAQEGDIITAIAGETVENLRDVSNLLLRYAPGDVVTVTLYRPASSPSQQGQELEVEIFLLEDRGETQN